MASSSIRFAITLVVVLCSVHLGYSILCYSCGSALGSEDGCDIPTITSTVSECIYGTREACISYTFTRNFSTQHTPIVIRGCAFDYDCTTTVPYPIRDLTYCHVCTADFCNNEIFINPDPEGKK